VRRKGRTHSPEFKLKVAIAAIAELVKKFNVYSNQITERKKQLLDGAPDVFDKGAKKTEDTEETVQQLNANIGQLTMENDYLEHGLQRIYGPRGKK
jgi:transposase